MIQCPICKSIKITNDNTTPNGGNLFVAEELEGSIEYIHTIEKYECENNHIFFIVTYTT